MRILISAILWLCVCVKLNPNHVLPISYLSEFGQKLHQILVVHVTSSFPYQEIEKLFKICCIVIIVEILKAYERFLSLELIQKLAVSAKCKYNKSITVCLSAMQNDNERFPDCSCITEHPELDYHLKATKLILVLFFMLPLTGKNYTFHIFVVALEIYP